HGAQNAELKPIGGSGNDAFNNIVLNQALRAVWASSDPDQLHQQYQAALAGMMGLKPGDELEGMMAAQLVAVHNAAMECFRRAMIPEQTFEGRESGLKHAVKLSRAYADLLLALDKHRGKGQQRVTVEHVHVHQGGQAIVGAVNAGGGVPSRTEDQPHAPGRLTDEPGAPLPCSNQARDRMPIAGG
ncbi:MAG: hypothetical protein JO001_27435, partial [Alphaproteobacteria bacterium]|nr:hypothetical protein [Alphaproteobacteria bacterium]